MRVFKRGTYRIIAALMLLNGVMTFVSVYQNRVIGQQRKELRAMFADYVRSTQPQQQPDRRTNSYKN